MHACTGTQTWDNMTKKKNARRLSLHPKFFRLRNTFLTNAAGTPKWVIVINSIRGDISTQEKYEAPSATSVLNSQPVTQSCASHYTYLPHLPRRKTWNASKTVAVVDKLKDYEETKNVRVFSEHMVKITTKFPLSKMHLKATKVLE